ncbi:MAG: hypothetical protein ACLQGP_12230 [Isosphaeraceae bacterium]
MAEVKTVKYDSLDKAAPKDGTIKDTIILAQDPKNTLYIRVFDANGKCTRDTDSLKLGNSSAKSAIKEILDQALDYAHDSPTKVDATKAEIVRKDVATALNSFQMGVGVTVKVNEKTFTLHPTDLRGLDHQVIDVGLPIGTMVQLGTVRQDFNALMRLFKADYSSEELEKEVNGLPLVEDLTEKLLEAAIAIEKFHLRYDGGATTKLTYTVVISLSWPQGIGLKEPDLTLTLQGISFCFSNE